MSTAVLAAAALLVLYSSSELALTTCTSASETSTLATEPGEMETISHDPSSNFVRMQRKISSIGLVGCLFPARRKESSTRSFGSFRRRRQEPSISTADKTKPKYVHTPQYAADSHVRTTTPIPFSMRPLSQDVTIQPVKAPVPIPFGMRPMSSEITIQPAKAGDHFMEQEQARKAASQGGRVHVVGTSAK